MKSALLIDDDPIVRKVLSKALSTAGWAVHEAKDGEEGIQAALRHRPDAVICDLLMPRCNGFQVCRALREQADHLPGLKIIVTTHRGFATDRLNAFESGADHYLVKPILAEDILQLLTSKETAKASPSAPAGAPVPAAQLPAGNLLRFWGVRGSIPTPGPNTVFYGGNTTCVELRADGQLIILDSGSGIRLLGQRLVEEFKGRSLELTLLLTHTHWDHIQGFPFFAPAYVANNQVHIQGYEGYRKGLESTLAVQMESSYFPVGLRQLPSNITFSEQREMEFHVGPVRVRAIFANHPSVCVGYRLDTSTGSVAFLPDHESYARMRLHPRAGGPKGQATLDYCRAEDQKLVEFLRGVDMLILDAQYDEAEYQTHIGWGHSCYEDSVATALAAGAQHLFLFHHDPAHDDARVSRMVGHARELAGTHNSTMSIEAAREGLEVPLLKGQRA
ncbi:MAG: beta-lactamase domain-containing protein [Limisphaerales bacterium]|nr:MAG: beta-lactamase domain-containing protein [Limisphaerales bacterium]KAG0507758.1 MAG: beta-lactamase domain-containing protein [Limisphaerales bacterium]TXT51077.1 MAG: beta-lactamase domain-containing protein [Limisphaerales bacterium]